MIENDTKLSLIENEFSNDEKYNKTIKITSEAFPNSTPDFIKNNPKNYINFISEIHLIISKIVNFIPTKEMIYFGKLKMEHFHQIVTLHGEWFPVNYSRDYLANFIHENEKNTIALGCFINLNGVEYVVGSILCNYNNENKFYKSAKNILKNRNCIKRYFSKHIFGYVATLGVINEFRNLGIAKNLIEMSIEIMKNKINCVAVYLHVIDYNKSAINFYNKIGFENICNIKDFYAIYDATFDCSVFVKFLNISNIFVDKYNYLIIEQENNDEHKININSIKDVNKHNNFIYKIYYFIKNLF